MSDRIFNKWHKLNKKYGLRACPHCGSTNIALVRGMGSNTYACSCDECSFSGYRAITIKKAIKQWNRIAVEGLVTRSL